MSRRVYHHLERKILYLRSFLLLCSLLIIWYILPFFLFPLQNIYIFGYSNISPEIVLDSLEHLKSTPLLRIREGYITSLLDSGWVKEIKTYKLPPHILLLRIKERVPFLIIVPEKGSPLLVDEEGFVIENPTKMSGLPSLYLTSAEVDENKMLSLSCFKEIKEIFEELKGTPIKIEKLSLSPSEELRIFTGGGLEIIMGDSNELFQKIFLLKALWERIPNIEERLVYINLSCPSKPAIMEKKKK